MTPEVNNIKIIVMYFQILILDAPSTKKLSSKTLKINPIHIGRKTKKNLMERVKDFLLSSKLKEGSNKHPSRKNNNIKIETSRMLYLKI